MTNTVARMTREELQEMIELAIEHKLLEVLGDPDEGLPFARPFVPDFFRAAEFVKNP